jgi:hypothetical protein
MNKALPKRHQLWKASNVFKHKKKLFFLFLLLRDKKFFFYIIVSNKNNVLERMENVLLKWLYCCFFIIVFLLIEEWINSDNRKMAELISVVCGNIFRLLVNMVRPKSFHAKSFIDRFW